MGLEVSGIKEAIISGETSLGIELGSTRIKAVLINEAHEPIASGSYDWTNSYVDNLWTYGLEEIWLGIQESYQSLVKEVEDTYGVLLTTTGAIGFSAMMHGYLVFDASDTLLVPFRTWRNNLQGTASEALTRIFNYPVPQRWSIAHLYQAILNQETHVKDIAFQTTLAGYVHWQLTGERVLGIGEASGMFPIDLRQKSFNQSMMHQFDGLVKDQEYPWQLGDILPKVLVAGDNAGFLTEAGARLIDVTGQLKAGIPMCPPEGDAGTGMVATNSVARKTGNVSAGTSVFAMIVLDKNLSKVYPEIDQVTTPAGDLVAMAHSNNCTSNLDSWVKLFAEALTSYGVEVDMTRLYKTLYKKALEGAPDGGGLLSYGYLSGEHMTHFKEGRPLFARTPDSLFTLANFMRANLFTSLGALKIGLDILLKDEGVVVDEILGHGGFFKTEHVGQRFMAAAANVPVALMATAGEGGAWGIALLAAYMNQKVEDESLADYLENQVFAGKMGTSLAPDPKDVAGFEAFMDRYKDGLAIERAAVNHLN